MTLTAIDWAIVAAYFIFTAAIGFVFTRKGGESMSEYFISGRQVPWWLAGASMVATTFAADTPLVVTGLVYTQGIAGNWLWWAFLLSGMMTVFLFARLWRRSELLTDVQFAELRYAGKPAAFLRGFRALYLGLLMNCLILGWVTKAMNTIIRDTVGVTMAHWGWLTAFSHGLTSIFGQTFAGPDGEALIISVFILIPFTGLYVALGGLWGVLWTDVFQFILKMGIVIGVAYYAVVAAGGMQTMMTRIEAVRATNGGSNPFAFFPDFSRGLSPPPPARSTNSIAGSN